MIFKIAKQIKKNCENITGDTCIKDENRNLCFRKTAKRPKWQDHHENLLNAQFT